MNIIIPYNNISKLAFLCSLISLAVYIIYKYNVQKKVNEKLLNILNKDEKIECEYRINIIVEYIVACALGNAIFYVFATIFITNYKGFAYITKYNAIFILIMLIIPFIIILIMFASSITVFTNTRKISIINFRWLSKIFMVENPIRSLSDVKNYKKQITVLGERLKIVFNDNFTMYLAGIQNYKKVRDKVIELIESNKKEMK